MSELLIVIVPSLIAIVIMVLLIKATGIARPVVLDDDAPVKQTIAEHFVGAEVDRIVRSSNGASALVYLKNAPGLVLVRALGDRMAVRALNALVLKSLAGNGTKLGIALKDFTWPTMQIDFIDENARKKEETTIRAAIDSTLTEPAHA